MARVLQVKRGAKATMPVLAQAEFGFATDTDAEELYIGNGSENIPLARKDKVVTKDDLQDATDTVLAQAKASGEFDGADGADGVGIQSVEQTTTSTTDGGTNIVTVIKTDGGTSTFSVKNGSKGSDGSPGAAGANGQDGKSAYEVAVDNGYSGTETEWLESLKASTEPVTTAGTGAAYTATVAGISALTAGVCFVMIPHTSSTSTSPTLDVNGLGAKSIRRRVTALSDLTVVGYAYYWLRHGKPFLMLYDGTYWIAVDMPQSAAADMYGTLSVAKGGTGVTDYSDDIYTQPRYRASALVAAETAPDVNGVINWTYE